MIAALYARKSTEQNGADADAKSVARQIENARAFAATKGWTVADAHVYADDAVSGAETKKLVHRQRLLDAMHAPCSSGRHRWLATNSNEDNMTEIRRRQAWAAITAAADRMVLKSRYRLTAEQAVAKVLQLNPKLARDYYGTP